MNNTIANTTMLVSLELGLPRQATQLKVEAAKIENENNAEHGTVKPPSITYFRKSVPNTDPKVKKKMVEVDGLELLKEFQSDYKRKVMELAPYPYVVGFYLAPAVVVEDLLKLKVKAEASESEVWKNWADNVYPEWYSDAPARMGALYNKADFPDLSECRKRYRSAMLLLPLAEKEQIARISLISPSSKEMLMAHADETSKASIAALHKQIWTDLMKPLQHVVDVFSKDKPKIYETLIGNLMQIVNVIPSYKELCNDPELEAAAMEAKAVFETITTEDLRTSEETRKLALTQATSMVAKFTPFVRKFA